MIVMQAYCPEEATTHIFKGIYGTGWGRSEYGIGSHERATSLQYRELGVRESFHTERKIKLVPYPHENEIQRRRLEEVLPTMGYVSILAD